MISIVPTYSAFDEKAATSASRRSFVESPSKLGHLPDTILPPLLGETFALASALAAQAPRVLLFCGAAAHLTTGPITADVGRALVQLGHGPVLAIEADRTHRSLESYLRLSAGPGLIDELHDRTFAEQDLLRCVSPDFSAMGLGSSQAVLSGGDHPFATSKLPGFIQRMRRTVPWVLLAAPAPGSDVDTSLLSRHVDAVILMVERGVQRRSEILALQARFAAHLPHISVVLV